MKLEDVGRRLIVGEIQLLLSECERSYPGRCVERFVLVSPRGCAGARRAAAWFQSSLPQALPTYTARGRAQMTPMHRRRAYVCKTINT